MRGKIKGVSIIMKIDVLQKYFDDAKSSHIAFEGKCHDCGKEITVNIDADKKELSISGGAVYNIEDQERIFLKCESCYKINNTLHNYQPCEVYSRIVGYLRPISQWNTGKVAEFNDRKMFDNQLN